VWASICEAIGDYFLEIDEAGDSKQYYEKVEKIDQSPEKREKIRKKLTFCDIASRIKTENKARSKEWPMAIEEKHIPLEFKSLPV